MFNNLQELIQEIENGKDTKTIVKERLAFLKSADYQKNMYKGNNSSASCEFVQGYISDDVKYSFGWIGTTCYWMDEEDIYVEIIDKLIKGNLSKIKNANVLPMYSLINGIRHYFQSAKPKEDSLIVYNEMKRNGLSQDEIREDFGEKYKEYCLRKKNKVNQQDLSEKISERENIGDIIPIPISAIKGLNIGQCTEMALLSQNILSFLGYNAFLIKGESFNSKGKQEAHNFNAVEKDGKYIIFDSALLFCAVAPKIKTPEDLLIFDSMDLQSNQKTVSYISNRKSHKYSDSELKMKILSKKGENYRATTIADLKSIMLSKQLIDEKGETRDE